MSTIIICPYCQKELPAVTDKDYQRWKRHLYRCRRAAGESA